MKIRLDINQYKIISEFVKKEISEQGDTNSEPSKGTSPTQSGGKGYPQVGKWESGITRGPGNQIGITKWSDVVGNNLKRGKANQLKENIDLKDYFKDLLIEQRKVESEYEAFDVPNNVFGYPKLYLPKDAIIYTFGSYNTTIKNIYGHQNEQTYTYDGVEYPLNDDSFPSMSNQMLIAFTTPIDNYYYNLQMIFDKNLKKFQFVWYKSYTKDNLEEGEIYYIHTNYVDYRFLEGDMNLTNYAHTPTLATDYFEDWKNPLNYVGIDRPEKPTEACYELPYSSQEFMGYKNGKTYNERPWCQKVQEGLILKEWVDFWYLYRSPLGKKFENSTVSYKIRGYDTYRLKYDFVSNKEYAQKRYEYEENLWLNANYNTTLQRVKNFENRISPGGLTVPPGFTPSKDYDVMMAEIKPKQDEIKKLNNELRKTYRQPEQAERITSRILELEKQIKNITAQNYSKEFSYGLDNEEREIYDKKIKEINETYDPLIKDALIKLESKRKEIEERIFKERAKVIDKQQTFNAADNTYYRRPPPPLSTLPKKSQAEIDHDKRMSDEYFKTLDVLEKDYYDWDEIQLDNQYQAIVNEKNMAIDSINIMFGRDDWYENQGAFGFYFDEFMKKYGTAFSIVGNIVIVALSGGIGAFFLNMGRWIGLRFMASAMTQATVRAVATTVTDASFNGFLSVHYASKGEKLNTLISLMCTVLPFISYAGNVGKISLSEAELLHTKIMGVDFTNAAQVQIFYKSLTPTQRYMIRNATMLSGTQIKQGYDLLFQRTLSELEKNGLKVTRAPIKIWLPPILKIIGVEGLPPIFTGLVGSLMDYFKQNSPIEYDETQLSNVREYIEVELKKLTIPQAIILIDKFDKEQPKFDTKEAFVELVRKNAFHTSQRSSDQDKINAARIIGKPDNYFTNPEKYDKISKELDLYGLPMGDIDPNWDPFADTNDKSQKTTPTPTPTPTPVTDDKSTITPTPTPTPTITKI